MNTEKSNTNELRKLALNLPKGLDLRSSNKRIALQSLFVYYMWWGLVSQKKFYKTENGENVPSLEVVEVDLAQCNL